MDYAAINAALRAIGLDIDYSRFVVPHVEPYPAAILVGWDGLDLGPIYDGPRLPEVELVGWQPAHEDFGGAGA